MQSTTLTEATARELASLTDAQLRARKRQAASMLLDYEDARDRARFTGDGNAAEHLDMFCDAKLDELAAIKRELAKRQDWPQ